MENKKQPINFNDYVLREEVEGTDGSYIDNFILENMEELKSKGEIKGELPSGRPFLCRIYKDGGTSLHYL